MDAAFLIVAVPVLYLLVAPALGLWALRRTARLLPQQRRQAERIRLLGERIDRLSAEIALLRAALSRRGRRDRAARP